MKEDAEGKNVCRTTDYDYHDIILSCFLCEYNFMSFISFCVSNLFMIMCTNVSVFVCVCLSLS
jgi:hypothetical protein